MSKNIIPRHYQCSLDGKHWWYTLASSPGQAKQDYIRMLDGCVDGCYLSIKCRVANAKTSEAFKENAKYRNIPFAYVGMNVKVGGNKGIIVGHNDSANLDIFFIEGDHAGSKLNCHPNWKIQYYDKKWNLIKEF